MRKRVRVRVLLRARVCGCVHASECTRVCNPEHNHTRAALPASFYLPTSSIRPFRPPSGPQVIAFTLNTEQINGLRVIFEAMDEDKSGTLSLDEVCVHGCGRVCVYVCVRERERWTRISPAHSHSTWCVCVRACACVYVCMCV